MTFRILPHLAFKILSLVLATVIVAGQDRSAFVLIAKVFAAQFTIVTLYATAVMIGSEDGKRK